MWTNCLSWLSSHPKIANSINFVRDKPSSISTVFDRQSNNRLTRIEP